MPIKIYTNVPTQCAKKIELAITPIRLFIYIPHGIIIHINAYPTAPKDFKLTKKQREMKKIAIDIRFFIFFDLIVFAAYINKPPARDGIFTIEKP
jgi:hypothetical protein